MHAHKIATRFINMCTAVNLPRQLFGGCRKYRRTEVTLSDRLLYCADRPEQHDLGCQLLLQVSKTSLNTTDTPLSISQSPLAGTSRHSQAGFILPERPQSTGSSMESSTQSLSCNTSARTSRRGSTAGSFSGERQRVTGGMSTLIQASDSSLTASSSSRLDERSSGSSTSQGNHEQQKAAILAGAGVAVLQQFRLAAMLQEWRNLQQQLRR